MENIMNTLNEKAPEYVAMWKNYTNFNDRTTKRGYWMAVVFNLVAAGALSAIASIIPELIFLSSIYSLAILVPSLALAVRRLNDIGKSWTSIFLGLIPIAGPFILIFLLVKDSAPENGVPTV